MILWDCANGTKMTHFTVKCTACCNRTWFLRLKDTMCMSIGTAYVLLYFVFAAEALTTLKTPHVVPTLLEFARSNRQSVEWKSVCDISPGFAHTSCVLALSLQQSRVCDVINRLSKTMRYYCSPAVLHSTPIM